MPPNSPRTASNTSAVVIGRPRGLSAREHGTGARRCSGQGGVAGVALLAGTALGGLTRCQGRTEDHSENDKCAGGEALASCTTSAVHEMIVALLAVLFASNNRLVIVARRECHFRQGRVWTGGTTTTTTSTPPR